MEERGRRGGRDDEDAGQPRSGSVTTCRGLRQPGMNEPGMERTDTLAASGPGRLHLRERAGRLLADRRRLRLGLGIAPAVAAVAGLEASPAWAPLRGFIMSLDLDPVRAGLLQARLAPLGAALLAGARA